MKSGEFVPTIADNLACGGFVVFVNVWPVTRAFTDGKGFGYSVTPDTTLSQMSLLLTLREFAPCSHAIDCACVLAVLRAKSGRRLLFVSDVSFLRVTPTEFLAVRRVHNPANVR
ncbi:hypothetical protein KOR42_08810 [Thalassoglobus neptunius]|uniref:Uncharacterized protein n=1 Tax=Thalassoglobus neptunius TaxID=1938619 RepID=A0A5C5X3T2_9PLAN|nr:hypothetical protein KOR42_08810 [Thalassoglobus neptunius]